MNVLVQKGYAISLSFRAQKRLFKKRENGNDIYFNEIQENIDDIKRFRNKNFYLANILSDKSL